MTEGSEIAPSESDINFTKSIDNLPPDNSDNSKIQLEQLRKDYKKELIREESRTHGGGKEFAENFEKVDEMSLKELREALGIGEDWKNN